MNNSIIKLTTAEKDFLISNKLFSFSNESMELIVSDEEVDVLRDKCSDLLQEIGFDKNYFLTKEGKILEALIDKLYI